MNDQELQEAAKKRLLDLMETHAIADIDWDVLQDRYVIHLDRVSVKSFSTHNERPDGYTQIVDGEKE